LFNASCSNETNLYAAKHRRRPGLYANRIIINTGVRDYAKEKLSSKSSSSNREEQQQMPGEKISFLLH